MPIIKLPDHLRDAVPSALANHLTRRIEKGSAVAVLTYQRAENGERQYLVEFKSTENANVLASYCGQSGRVDGKQRVPLFPYLPDWPQELERNTDAGDQVFALEHSPPEGGEDHGFRVEFTLPGSPVAHLALEARAQEGETVPLQRTESYRSRSERWQDNALAVMRRLVGGSQ